MKSEEIAKRVVALVTQIAPDVEASSVLPDVDFRDQFDFDSMDTLNFAIALNKEFGIEVPEADYAKLASTNKCVKYVQGKLD
jgi:acyl carrier protein